MIAGCGCHSIWRAVFVCGLAIETWFRAHYFAPATALLYLIVIQCMRHLRCWRRETGAGATLVRAVPLICCGMVILRITALLAHAQIEPVYPRGNLKRARIVRALESRPGQDLVFVRYAQDHIPDDEWVYNAADIDAAKNNLGSRHGRAAKSGTAGLFPWPPGVARRTRPLSSGAFQVRALRFRAKIMRWKHDRKRLASHISRLTPHTRPARTSPAL